MIRAVTGVLSCVAVVGCASAQAAVDANEFGFPAAASQRSIATATLYTSPDGGIYRNPDRLDVVMVVRHSEAVVAAHLGGVAALWRPLTALGDFTFVGVILHNNGKAWSDPQLNEIQIASDFAPSGTAAGPLKHFYHPMFPLALISASSSGSNCSLHTDAGASMLAVLVYPPLRAAGRIVWGIYDDFAVSVPFGGALANQPASWRVTACSAPEPPPP